MTFTPVAKVRPNAHSVNNRPMRSRTSWPVLGVVAVAGVVAWWAASPQAQGGPRTPWGDPDLQGTYTNTYEQGTPLERPEQFAGRKLEDVSGASWRGSARRSRSGRSRAFEGPIHAPDHWWQDNLFLERGSQAWFIVDPPDGRIPPLTPEAQQRNAARAAARKTSGRGEADSWTDRSLYDRCLTRGVPGSMMPAIYGNSSEIVQAPGYVVIRNEMIHEARVIPLDGRAAISRRRSRRTWAMPAGTGRGTRWWSRPPTSRSGACIATPTPRG